MVHLRAVCCAAVLALVASGCGAPGSGGAAPRFRGKEVRPDEFTLVFLHSGDRLPGASEADLESAMEEHYDFMGQLAMDGSLLVAGPFGNDKARDGLRGLFVLDGASVDACVSLAAKDPMAMRGYFAQQPHSLMAPDSIRRLPEMYRELDSARSGVDQAPSNPVLGDYVVMVARDGKAAFSACMHEALAPKVVLLGRMGGELEGALFGVFDATDPGEIRARLTVAGYGEGAGNEAWEGLELSQWLASPALRGLVQVE